MNETQTPVAQAPQQDVQAVTGRGMRNYNERALLSALRRHGSLSSASLARKIGVSAQTASVITRALEKASLLRRGAPQKGKVGKPQIPVTLNPDGAFALGLRVGRRGADTVVMDLVGDVRSRFSISYAYPTPPDIEAFVKNSLETAQRQLGPGLSARLCGLGVGIPFEMWNWLDAFGAPAKEANQWRSYDIAEGLKNATNLQVYVANDVNMACCGELMFAPDADTRDFAYFYVGAFVGGGFVLDGQVYHGPRGNAGAFGSIPIATMPASTSQLIRHASVYTLEEQLKKRHPRGVNLREDETLWRLYESDVAQWIASTGRALAQASVAVTAVLDTDMIVIDGSFPEDIRNRLTDATSMEVQRTDRTGLNPFEIRAGHFGATAGTLGAGYQPILKAHFLEGYQLS